MSPATNGHRGSASAWRVSSFCGELQLRCHAQWVWVTPQQAQNYDLTPADIPLLADYIAAQVSLG